MKKVLISLGVITVVSTLAIGATVAYFSDTEISNGNTITAGVLDLQLQCPPETVTAMGALHPDSGTDTTGMGTDPLNSGELAALATSDDSRYTSNYGWYTTYLAGTETEPYEFLNFGMSNIPDGATITSASLNMEWQRGTGVNAARVRVYDGSTWRIVTLALPPANADAVSKIDLYSLGFDTKAELDALRIQFQATQSGGYDPTDAASKTATDLVEVNANYSITGEPTWCDDDLTGTFVVSDVKPGDNNSGSPATINYHNNGSISGTLTMKVTSLVNNENICLAPEQLGGPSPLPDNTCNAGQGELGDYLHLYNEATDLGTLNAIAAGSGIDLGSLAGGADGSVTLSWDLPSDTGNIIQSDGVDFNLEFKLDQQT